MKRMLNEASAFREEMIAGYAGAYGRYLRRVPGASGVMANGTPAPGRVSVVVGGGSGHYPAFYGLVGQGLASARRDRRHLHLALRRAVLSRGEGGRWPAPAFSSPSATTAAT